MMTLTFPGKLYIIGEYNVMASGHSAILCAINKTMSFNIKSNSQYHIICDYGNIITSDIADIEPIAYVYQAIKVAHEYLTSKQIPVKPFQLEIVSELEDKKSKYGFGSSGVVIVGVIASLLEYHKVTIDKLTLFKLSVYAQMIMNELSSGGDLATTIYKDTILYTRYDNEWLHKQPLTIDLVDKNWPLLHIEILDFPYELMVGWTQTSNKTQSSLKLFKVFEKEKPELYTQWILEAEEITQEFKRMYHNEMDTYNILKRYEDHLNVLQNEAEINIITPDLKQLVSICHHDHIPAKLSGSGGGDCGFGLLNDKLMNKEVNILNLWAKHGILYIDVKRYKNAK